MVTTKTREVARLLSAATGRGHSIFNDRLADGTRSLKVWGWTAQDYVTAQALLENMGCKVRAVRKEKYSIRGGRKYMMTRLYVQE